MANWIAIRQSLLVIGLICLTATSFANARDNLKQVQQRIKASQQVLQQKLQQRQTLQQQLQDSELAISQLQTKLAGNQKALRGEKQKLSVLMAQRQRLQKQQLSEQKTAALAIRSAYRMGKLQTLKILLSQQDPAKFNIMLHYYQALLNARQQSLARITATLKQLSQTEQAISDTQESLENTQEQLHQQQQALLAHQQQRQQAVQQINHSISSDQERIALLQAKMKKLADTIKKLQASPFNSANFRAFRRMRGKLAWPVKGYISRQYGQLLGNSRVRAAGVVIAAKAGKAVYAIAPGRVVYANWMSGYGLLVIINHGHGYMSIYGRNQALFVHQGEFVKAGTRIASVGNTGGHAASGLYFALRWQSKPINPNRWCIKRHKNQTVTFG